MSLTRAFADNTSTGILVPCQLFPNTEHLQISPLSYLASFHITLKLSWDSFSTVTQTGGMWHTRFVWIT